MADLSRSYPLQHRVLGDDPELRLLRRHRDLHFHFRIHRRLRLWPCDARPRLHHFRCAHSQARLADLCRAYFPLHDLSGGDRLCGARFPKSALCRRDGHSRFPSAAGRHDRRGAASEIQAGQHGRAAALHRAAAVVSADPVALAAQAHARPDRVGGALRRGVGIRMESARLSERALVFQPVRLAAPVRVRCVVRARRLRPAVGAPSLKHHDRGGRALSRVCVLRHADLAFPAARIFS